MFLFFLLNSYFRNKDIMLTNVQGIMRDLQAEQKEYDARWRKILATNETAKQADIRRIVHRLQLEPDEFLTAEEKTVYHS